MEAAEDTDVLVMMAVALEAGPMVEVEAGLVEMETGLKSELEPEVEIEV